MKRSSLLTIGLISITLTLPRPAWACCNDFWSCAGAVATAGASCLIQEALNRLNALIQRVKSESESKQRAFNEEVQGSLNTALSETQRQKQIADLSLQRLRDYVAEANRLAGDDKMALDTTLRSAAIQQQPATSSRSTGAAARMTPGTLTRQSTVESAAVSKPAITSEAIKQLLADNSIESLRQQIHRERDLGNAARERAVLARQAADEAMRRSSEKTDQAFRNAFMAQIGVLLVALGAATTNPLAFDIGALVLLLDGAFVAFDRDVVPEAERDAALKDMEVEKVMREADAAKRNEERGRYLLAEMRKGVRFKTVAERRSLVSSALGATGASVATAATRLKTKTGGPKTALFQTFKASRLQLRAQLHGLNTAKKTADLTLARQRTTASFDQYYKGKTVNESRLLRDQLLAEARKIYSNDQNLRLAVEKLINAEAYARGIR